MITPQMILQLVDDFEDSVFTIEAFIGNNDGSVTAKFKYIDDSRYDIRLILEPPGKLLYMFSCYDFEDATELYPWFSKQELTQRFLRWITP